jgi:DNA-binding transcriptional regulator YhcF (GntR family)
MKNKWKSWAICTLMCVSLAGQAWSQPVQGSEQGRGGMRHPAPFFQQLTEEQRQELESLREEMVEAGATREEIREAIHAQLEAWGVDVPERSGPRGPQLDLTEEQKQELKQLRQELREAGASREEIHEAIRDQLEAWGIDPPERRMGRRGPRPDLTEGQKQELKQLRQELREAGASREEIREAIRDQLEEWGIEPPERRMGRRGPRLDLTEEQKQELKQLRQELREAGASREEIREAIRDQLEAWGIEPPQHSRGAGERPRLTPEQKEMIRERVQQLREDGASRQEIRQAVREMIESWKENGGEADNAELGHNSLQQDTGIKLSNHPNPFNPETRITYTLPEAGNVTLAIYSVNGQRVRTLVNGYRSAGTWNVTWNGRNELGVNVPSGTYFYRLTMGSQIQTEKMVLTR